MGDPVNANLAWMRHAGAHFLVDLNYFPSYKGVPRAKEELWSLCLRGLERRGIS